MKRMVFLSAVCMVLAAATVALSGCPALGIGGEKTNEVIVHNQMGYDVFILNVVQVGDECSNDKPEGLNLLPQPLAREDSYTVENLPDGRYYCKVSTRGYSAAEGYVTLFGGMSVDWFARLNQ